MKSRRRKEPKEPSSLITSVVVIGSYREDLPGLLAFSQSLVRIGFKVLHPPPQAHRLGEDDGFVRLNCDRSWEQKKVQQDVFLCIEHADVVILYTPTGRLGISAAMEIGYSLRASKPIFATAPPQDLTIRALIEYEPAALANFLRTVPTIQDNEHARTTNG